MVEGSNAFSPLLRPVVRVVHEAYTNVTRDLSYELGDDSPSGHVLPFSTLTCDIVTVYPFLETPQKRTPKMKCYKLPL